MTAERQRPITFVEFANSKRIEENLGDIFPSDFVDDAIGLSYLDGSYYIEKQYEADAIHAELHNVHYVVTIGNGSFNFGDDLAAAEEYLWDEFVLLETNPQLSACRFGWDDESYDGFTDGSTWNGWDNVCVSEKVHKQICEEFDALLPTSHHHELKELLALPRNEKIEDAIHDLNSFHLVEQDEFRLYDYGNCYTTTIDEDHHHIVNR